MPVLYGCMVAISMESLNHDGVVDLVFILLSGTAAPGLELVGSIPGLLSFAGPSWFSG